MKHILLTFDIEEFDLPRERGIKISREQEFEISKQGFLSILTLLSKHKVNATLFITASFAKAYPAIIRLAKNQGHEIASHGHSHSDNYTISLSKIKDSKKIIEDITNSQIKGFRAPRFQIKNIKPLSEFDFKYDSSVHPTIIPGRYMGVFKKRTLHKIGNIAEIPPSTLPFLRLPISWISFRNLGINYAKLFTRINMAFSDYTMLLFHPWEFTDLSNFKIPSYFKKNSGKKLISLLDNYLDFAKTKNYSFLTISDFLEKSFK